MLTHINPFDTYSLYIHVPFCTSRCSYCAFYSEVASTVADGLRIYGNRLTEEIGSVVGKLETPFATAYLGGGNPGLLPIGELTGLLDLICRRGPIAEITMEMNPESLRMEHSLLFEHGLSRLSIGIQSMDERHLKTLGRNASVGMNMRAASVIGEFRKTRTFGLNCDLMTCIPGQTIGDAISDIDSVIALFDPDHISLYNLTVEEGTPLAKSVGDGSLHVMDEDGQAKMLQACWRHLKSCGFEHYEISNFSRSRSSRSHHNERYWQLENYIGIGPSAAGTLFISKSTAIRTTGESDLFSYTHQGPFSNYSYEILEEPQLMLETLLVGLRTIEGIDKDAWDRRFSHSFDPLFDEEASLLDSIHPGLFHDTGKRFALGEEGFMILDAIVLRLSRAIGKIQETRPT